MRDKSRPLSAMRACPFATLRRACSRFLERFCFFAWRRGKGASRCSSFVKKWSLPDVSPVERLTTSYTPRSLPTDLGETGHGWMSSSIRRETKERPAGSLLTVLVGGLTSLGRGRLPIRGKGSLILASVTGVPSQVKAAGVSSADCLACCFLNVGSLARSSKKVRKAHVLRGGALVEVAHRTPRSTRTSLGGA